jgi:hypothetical protein
LGVCVGTTGFDYATMTTGESIELQAGQCLNSAGLSDPRMRTEMEATALKGSE